jgi:hypothetical protein
MPVLIIGMYTVIEVAWVLGSATQDLRGVAGPGEPSLSEV